MLPFALLLIFNGGASVCEFVRAQTEVRGKTIMECSGQHYSKRENYNSDYKRYDDYKKGQYDQQGQHPHKKKKSFLEDFFDF